MLAVLAAVVACATLILVEGSIVYYRHPAAPAWLKNSPSLQTTLSTSFSMGMICAVVMLAQFFADKAVDTISIWQLALIAASVAVAVWAWRKIRRIGRAQDIARGKVSATVVDYSAAEAQPPQPSPGHPAPSKKAA